MPEMTTPQRRRIDRVLDPAFIAGIDGLDPAEVRSRLAEARSEEEELSYLRRLVHGELDIFRAELELREGDRAPEQDVVDRLAAVLGSGPERSSRGARARVSPPAGGPGRRRAERILSESRVSRLPDLSPDEIRASVDRLMSEERTISDERRRVHAVIDVLEGELLSRYKAGLAPPV